MIKLLRFLKNYKKETILGPAFKLVEAIFELIVPLVVAKIIDIGIPNKDVGYIIKMGGLMILLGIIGLCSTLVCQKYAAVASQGVGTEIRNSLYKHISNLSYENLDTFGTPSIIIRLSNDVNQLQVAVAMLIRLCVRAPFLVIGSLFMAISIDFKLSLIFLAIIPLIALSIYLVMRNTVPFYKKMQKKLDKISLITKENLQGVRVIRSFARLEHEETRFADATSQYTNIAVKAGRISALLNPLSYAILNLGIVAIIWFGGYRVYDGALSQGQIIAFVNYMTQILNALVVVANLVVIFTKAGASAARINEIFGTESSIIFPESDTEAAKTDIEIEFKNVSFNYEIGGDNELNNVSFQIKKGQTVGIIGATASGKTTLANLICRFYDKDEGEIFINGVAITNISKKTLRKKIGIVPQKAALLSGSIAENLRMGNKASDEELYKALEIAQAKDFVDKLPKKLETLISQGGQNLSGGQRQRLTIARALVANPDILILDDSSSALDYATDAALRNALKKYKESHPEKVQILISQRISTVEKSDIIFVMDDSRLAGEGSHEFLLENCSVYKEIYNSQNKSED